MRYWQCLILVVVAYQGYGQAPIIRNVQPNYGYPGQVISILGENLGSNTEVRFGGVVAPVISRSSQLMEVEVPAGALFDNVSVLNTSSGLASHAPLPYTMSFGGVPGLDASNFDAQVDFEAENGLFDLCVCDLDGDGRNDIAAANSDDARESIFLNNSPPGPGLLEFNRASFTLNIANTLNVSCGDLNGDLRPELVFSIRSSPQLVILENNSAPGVLSFTPTVLNLPGIGDTKRVAIRDVNGDGRPEIIGTDIETPARVYILENNSSGGALNLNPTPIILQVANAQSTSAIEVIDMNGDNRPDIVVNQFSGNGIFIAINNSSVASIQFSSFTEFIADAPTTLKVADFDNDNKPDIAVTRSLRNEVSIFMNETSSVGGQVQLGPQIRVNTNERPWGLDLADFDGDGREDMLVGTLGSPRAVSVLRNTGTPGSVSFQTINVGVSTANRNVAAGDLDGDGRPDIAITSLIPNNSVSVLRNNKCLAPIIDPEGPFNLCSNNTQTQTLRTQKVAGATYTWEINGTPQSGNSSSINISTSMTGNYSYEVTIDEGDGCVGTSDPVSVNIGSSQSFSSPTFLSPSAPVCVGSDLRLEMSEPSYTYHWRGPRGFSVTDNPARLADFQFANSGVYEVDIEVGGCVVETQTITVEAIPAPEFSVLASTSDPVCQGDSIQLSVSPAGNPDFDYEWFDAGNNFQDDGETFQATVSGDYFVRATENNGTNCNAIQSPPVSVLVLEPPIVDFDLPASACVNSTIAFTDNSTLDGNATPAYQWDFGDGNTSSNPNPLHTYAAISSYTVTLTVTYPGSSCQDTLSQTLDVQPDLEVNIIAEPAVICQGESVELSTEVAYESYTWDTGENEASIVVSSAGNYGVSVTDNGGCQGFGQISLSAFPGPAVEVTASETTVAPGQQVQLNASGLASYSWEPAELLDDPSIPNPTATVSAPTTFEVSGEDDNGCPGSGSVQVITGGDLIGQLLNPKNFFSPNPGDNINATWTVEGILEFPQCLITIYDQTGNVLFEAQPYMNDWDGTSGGRDLPSGVYYFTINCGGDELARTGSITLLR